MQSKFDLSSTDDPNTVLSTRFTVQYDGPAIAMGSMPVDDLAPVLLAVANLVRLVDTELNGDRTKVSTSLVAPPRGGSFEVLMSVDQTLLDHLKSVVGGSGVVDADAILRLIFGGTGAGAGTVSLLGLFKWLRGRRAKPPAATPPGTTVKVEVAGDAIIVDGSVANIAMRPDVQQTVRTIGRPLTRAGIDRLSVADADDQPVFSVDRERNEQLTVAEGGLCGEGVIGDTIETCMLTIVALALEAQYVWRVGYPGDQQSFAVKMNDEDFMQSVIRRDSTFGHGDLLHVDLRIVQELTETGISTRRSIEKVHRHVHASDQFLPGLIDQLESDEPADH